MADIRKLLESMDKFAGQPEQVPGEQWRSTDAGTPGTKLVGEAAEAGPIQMEDIVNAWLQVFPNSDAQTRAAFGNGHIVRLYLTKDKSECANSIRENDPLRYTMILEADGSIREADSPSLLIAPTRPNMAYGSAKISKKTFKTPTAAKLLVRFKQIHDFVSANASNMHNIKFDINEKLGTGSLGESNITEGGDAYREGYMAAKNGAKRKDNPYDEYSKEVMLWNAGYSDSKKDSKRNVAVLPETEGDFIGKPFVREDQSDNILENLTSAYHNLATVDYHDEDTREEIKTIYLMLRSDLMKADLEEFMHTWEYVSGKYPDSFGQFAEQLFSEAGLGTDATIEDFMSRTDSLEEGDDFDDFLDSMSDDEMYAYDQEDQHQGKSDKQLGFKLRRGATIDDTVIDEGPRSNPIRHGDIVIFKQTNSHYEPMTYYRADTENAIGATSERPWIGDLESNSGWYVPADQLNIAVSADEADTHRFTSSEEVENWLEGYDLDEAQKPSVFDSIDFNESEEQLAEEFKKAFEDYVSNEKYSDTTLYPKKNQKPSADKKKVKEPKVVDPKTLDESTSEEVKRLQNELRSAKRRDDKEDIKYFQMKIAAAKKAKAVNDRMPKESVRESTDTERLRQLGSDLANAKRNKDEEDIDYLSREIRKLKVEIDKKKQREKGLVRTESKEFCWSDYEHIPSMKDRLLIAETYFTKTTNLTESNDGPQREYFDALTQMSEEPTSGNKYICTVLGLVGNKLLNLQHTEVIMFVEKDEEGYKIEDKQGNIKTYPPLHEGSDMVISTFFFSNKAAYNKFKTAVSIKFNHIFETASHETNSEEMRRRKLELSDAKRRKDEEDIDFLSREIRKLKGEMELRARDKVTEALSMADRDSDMYVDQGLEEAGPRDRLSKMMKDKELVKQAPMRPSPDKMQELMQKMSDVQSKLAGLKDQKAVKEDNITPVAPAVDPKVQQAQVNAANAIASAAKNQKPIPGQPQAASQQAPAPAGAATTATVPGQQVPPTAGQPGGAPVAQAPGTTPPATGSAANSSTTPMQSLANSLSQLAKPGAGNKLDQAAKAIANIK